MIYALLFRIFASISVQFLFLAKTVGAIADGDPLPELNDFYIVHQGIMEYSGPECMATAIATEIIFVSGIVILARRTRRVSTTLDSPQYQNND